MLLKWRGMKAALMALAPHIAYSSSMTQPHRPVGPGDHVFLVDGSSFVFRAYYQSIRQDQKYNYRLDRLPIGAVRLFATKVLKFIRDGAAGIKPTHLAISDDHAGHRLPAPARGWRRGETALRGGERGDGHEVSILIGIGDGERAGRAPCVNEASALKTRPHDPHRHHARRLSSHQRDAAPGRAPVARGASGRAPHVVAAAGAKGDGYDDNGSHELTHAANVRSPGFRAAPAYAKLAGALAAWPRASTTPGWSSAVVKLLAPAM